MAENKKSEGSKSSEDQKSYRVKYTGASVVERTLSAADFKTAGIEDVSKTTWDRSNRHIVDFSEHPSRDAIVTFLTEDEPLKSEFKTLAPGKMS